MLRREERVRQRTRGTCSRHAHSPQAVGLRSRLGRRKRDEGPTPQRGLDYEETDTASPLFNRLVDGGIVLRLMEKAVLAASTPRNKRTGHGAGAIPHDVPPEIAEAVLASAAVAIAYVHALLPLALLARWASGRSNGRGLASLRPARPLGRSRAGPAAVSRLTRNAPGSRSSTPAPSGASSRRRPSPSRRRLCRKRPSSDRPSCPRADAAVRKQVVCGRRGGSSTLATMNDPAELRATAEPESGPQLVDVVSSHAAPAEDGERTVEGV